MIKIMKFKEIPKTLVLGFICLSLGLINLIMRLIQVIYLFENLGYNVPSVVHSLFSLFTSLGVYGFLIIIGIWWIYKNRGVFHFRNL
jgi:hypothetical protein